MDYDIKLTKDAYADIEEIVGYMIDALKNSIAADNFLSEIEKSYNVIAKNPEAFAYCRDRRLRERGYRKLPVKNYILFYRADRENKIVYILRVVYCRRKYSDLL